MTKSNTVERGDEKGEFALDYSEGKHDASKGEKTLRVKLDSQLLKSIAAEGGFFSYVAGTAYVIVERYLKRRPDTFQYGISINNFKTTLPMRKGLSSSAAVCVLTAKCFDAVYELDLDMKEIMEIAYLGELASPSKCGRMDQASKVYFLVLKAIA
jgi:galactokinase